MQNADERQKMIAAWRRQEDYGSLLSVLQRKEPALYAGLPLLPAAMLAAALYGDLPQQMLVLCANEEEAVALADNLRPLLGEQVQLFPVLELMPFEVYAHNIELVAARMRVLSGLVRGERMLVVSCVNALSRRLPPPAVLRAHHLLLRAGDVVEPAQLARQLADMGYERVALTEIPGTFSQRGSIVDVFPITAQQPCRLEFFDDEIDSLRYFDAAEQRSGAAAEQLLLTPARELPVDDAARMRARQALQEEYRQTYDALRGTAKKELEKSYAPLLEYLETGVWDSGMEALMRCFYPDAGSLFDYLGDGTVILSEPQNIKETALSLVEERDSRYFDLLDSGRLLPSFYHNFLSYDELRPAFLAQRLLMLCHLSLKSGDIEARWQRSFIGRELPAYAQNPAAFSEDLRRFTQAHYLTVLSASSPLRLRRMEDILQENGCPPARLLQAGFTQGFESPQLKMAVITEHELFAQQTKKRRRRIHKGGEKIANFLDLRSGDLVVHISQGIGRYLGVQRLTIGDTERDYLLIQYAGEDRLYLPVDQLDLIQKYIGGEGSTPKLNKLGGGEWGRVKAKVRAAVRDMAEELVKLYAAREQAEGYAFSPDSAWQREFEDAFPYTETPDQLNAAEEIKADMESHRVMDRLLCGDVGYGKTEIALRAAFKAVVDGKQVAILVPTTVLAQQHYHTVLERFSGYPVKAGCLSRFSSAKEQKQLLARLAAGDIDIVVGTHRLLSKDVHFKDLGLLIVDEEQRFGVAHKERIKSLKTQVDVLTLSATPIPRTLHMALTGMRDMSLISTPPEARFPVRTYVVEYHERLIRDAIARELGRGGQVYYVHNRVFNIYDVAEELQRILPEARIAVGHGQMRERELEQVMLDFVAGEADVLVCTTIIESGLDIPNVNTLIVDDADMFGLAQLYQLRGRVGRSERQAFAYFTYRRDHVVNEVAKKRLIAIRDFTELGAGFKIAMRDLELRGAGNLLGPEQHGHIASVGFDLYCKLLAEEMEKARGLAPKAEAISTQLELAINAYIPDRFVEDSVLKVEIYKRLAAAERMEDIDALAAELIDRYGALPPVVQNLLLIGRVKLLAQRLGMLAILQKSSLIEIKFAEQNPVRGEHLLQLLTKWERRVTFSDKKGFFLRLSTTGICEDRARVELLLRMLTDLASAVGVDDAQAAADAENKS